MPDFVYDNVALPAAKIDFKPLPAGLATQGMSAADVNAVFDALTSLRGTVAFINVKSPKYGAVGDDFADDTAAILAARNDAASSGKTVVFPPGTYKYTSSPNWAVTGMRVIGLGKATLHFTGAGNAFVVDAGLGNNIYGLSIENLTIVGNAAATNGIFWRGVHHSVLRNVSVSNVSAAGLLTNFAVSNTFDTFRVSSNEGAFTTVPVNGMVLDQSPGNLQTTASTFITPIIEGVSGSGIKLVSTADLLFLAGTSEGCGRGLEVGVNAIRNTFDNIDLEANTIEDALVQGRDNQFRNILAASTGAQGVLHFNGASAVRNQVLGGVFNSITIDATSNSNQIDGAKYNLYGTGALTDNGTATMKMRIINMGSGAIENATLINGLTVGALTTTGVAVNDISGATTIRQPATFLNGVILARVLPTWGATISVDASTGNYFEVVASTNVAHTFNAPTNPTTGQRIAYKVKNTSGGVLGAATWNAIFKMLAWTPPTVGNNATISFVYDGTNWVQDTPQSVNVPN